MLNLNEDELMALGKEGLISAIKALRTRTGMGLCLAKEAVEQDALKMGLYEKHATPEIGTYYIRRMNPDANPPIQVAPESPEVIYLRRWLHYYEARDKAPAGYLTCGKPTGETDPTTAPFLKDTVIKAQAILNQHTPAVQKVKNTNSKSFPIGLLRHLYMPASMGVFLAIGTQTSDDGWCYLSPAQICVLIGLVKADGEPDTDSFKTRIHEHEREGRVEIEQVKPRGRYTPGEYRYRLVEWDKPVQAGVRATTKVKKLKTLLKGV